MGKRREVFGMVLSVMCIMVLTACQKESAASVERAEQREAEEASIESETGTEESTASSQSEESSLQERDSEAMQMSESGGTGTDDNPMAAPRLPQTGRELGDFVPEGWEILDNVELDFNEDGISDYVGVLERGPVDMEGDAVYQEAPRILFAIAADGNDGYRLNFQDANLIRTRDEGGVFGDPYVPLTAEGASFTTHAYGGSAWKWSEDFTYIYWDGTWYLSLRESTYGYGSYVTSYERDDWETGIGIRKKRSDEFSDMEEDWEEEGDLSGEEAAEETDSERDGKEPGFDVEYELVLEEPPTLYQVGMRWWLALKRVTDWTVESVELAAGMTIPKERVKRPEEVYLGGYCDENWVLYSFGDEDSGDHYLAGYRWQDRTLSVLARETGQIDDIQVYQGKVYYTAEVVEKIRYRTSQDGQEQVVEEADTVGIQLIRMNPDGSEKETVFVYRFPGADQEIMEGWPPYLAFFYEISGGEIVAEIYIGSEPHPVWRMRADGSEQRQIGQIPAEEQPGD